VSEFSLFEQTAIVAMSVFSSFDESPIVEVAPASALDSVVYIIREVRPVSSISDFFFFPLLLPFPVKDSVAECSVSPFFPFPSGLLIP